MLSYAGEQPLLLEPETNMTFTMEIQDPGKQAMTYEFEWWHYDFRGWEKYDLMDISFNELNN
ncbi:MAG: hypothetical protein ABFS05_11740, partial [Bacteroidota bacterium]